MDANADTTINVEAGNAAPTTGGDILEEAEVLWRELCQVAHDRFLLASLETQRAGESLVDMLVAGVMVAVLMVSAWLGLLAAMVLALIAHGWLASTAILLAVTGNLLLALIFCSVIRRKSRYLNFPATRRSFQRVATAHSGTKSPP